MASRISHTSVAEYIAAQPAPARPVLRRVRSIIRKALPGVVEGISYQIPVHKLDGRMVLYFAGFRHHYSIYPATARLKRELGDELAGLLHSKATIRFSYEDPIPAGLISRMAKLRAAEVRERNRERAPNRGASRKSKPAAQGTAAQRERR